ncbi:hypothetical protein HK096_008326, partial [Nowakowskiella sp. JEL0078]
MEGTDVPFEAPEEQIISNNSIVSIVVIPADDLILAASSEPEVSASSADNPVIVSSSDNDNLEYVPSAVLGLDDVTSLHFGDRIASNSPAPKVAKQIPVNTVLPKVGVSSIISSETPTTQENQISKIASPVGNTPLETKNKNDPRLSWLLESLSLTGLVTKRALFELLQTSSAFEKLVGKLAELRLNNDADSEISLKLKVENMKAERVTDRINFEQQAHTFERLSRKLNDELESAKANVESFQKQLESKDALLLETKLKFQNTTTALEQANSKVNSLSLSIEKMESEKRNLADVVDRGSESVSRMQIDINQLTAQLHSSRSDVTAVNETLITIQSELFDSKHKLATSEQLLSATRAENETTLSELQRKSDEYQRFRREKSEQIAMLQAQCDEAVQEKLTLEIKNQSLEERNEALNIKIQSLAEKVKESEDNSTLSTQQFRNEMTSQKRLNDLLTSENNDLRERNTELEILVQDMETAIESHESRNRDFQTEYENRLEVMQHENDELASQNEKLLNEVKAINEGMNINKTA